MAWCVVVYRFERPQMEIHGPYELRAIAATAAVMLELPDGIETAYVLPLEPT